MRKLATSLVTLGLLQCCAIAAFAVPVKYPPGPGGACPETLKISQVQNLAAACHPALLDTVLGVSGIVVGFDPKAIAYAFYIQNSQGGHYNGVQAFTGATNYNAPPFNLAIGDSVAVYGTTQEFPASNGTTEIEGPDVTQSTNDIIVRKISSGNPVTFNIVTTHKVNWVPGAAGNEGEQWEGSLVRIRVPVVVGRTSIQGGLPPLPFSSFLVYDPAAPADSTLIDGNTLTTYTPPAVGSVIDSIQGIVNQGTSNSVNSYRLQIRADTDVFGSLATSLSDAYPISDTFTGPLASPQDGLRVLGVSNSTLRLEFALPVDVASAQDENNYSLASGIDGSTVDLATVEGGSGRFVLLDITSVRTDGDNETVTASGIGSQSCPTCPMPTQNRAFINGVLDVKQVQAPHPDSLSVCLDRSRYAGTGVGVGTRISVRGVGVGQFGSLQYIEDPDAALRSGVSIFGSGATLAIGHRYLVAGQIQEFGGETEIVNTVFLQDQANVGAPAPIEFTDKQVSIVRDSTCDASQSVVNGEDYEGMLIRINRLMVTEKRTLGQSFFAGSVSGTVPFDTILVSNLNGVLNAVTPPDSGSIIDVTGVLHFSGGTFRICPRSAADIASPTVGVGYGDLPGRVSFSAYPNPARSTQIHFSLPRRDNVELGVYDLLGRRVAMLARGPMPAGAYTKQWDGRDDSGKQSGPGIYFLHLRVGQETYKLRSVMLN